MDEPPQLHPSIREHKEPRMTALALAEYLVLRADGQDEVLHNSRFAQTNIRAAYAAARHAFRAYNSDPLRPIATLNKAKESLAKKAADPNLTPRQQARHLRDIELIDLFILREQALGLRGLPLSRMPKLPPVPIEGVDVSIQPDFLINPPSGKIGSLMLRVTKAPDPDACKRDATRAERGEHRREIARYMVAMQEVLLNRQDNYRGKVDRELIFVSDVRLNERIGAGSDHTARMREIEAACRQVRTLWGSIKAQPRIYDKPKE
jgi:hypothetical protein